MIKIPKYLLATILQITGLVVGALGILYVLTQLEIFEYLGFGYFLLALLTPCMSCLLFLVGAEQLRLSQQTVDQLRKLNGEHVEATPEIKVFAAVPTAPTAPAASSGMFCPSCGAAQPAGTKFCSARGKQIQ